MEILYPIITGLLTFCITLIFRIRKAEAQLVKERAYKTMRRKQDDKAGILEAFMMDAFDHVEDVGFAKVSLGGQILRCNAAFLRISGNPEAEGRTWQDITHPDDIETDEDAVKALLEAKISFYKLKKRYIKDGEYFWIVLYTTLKTEALLPKYFIALVRELGDDEEKIRKVWYDGSRVENVEDQH